MCRQDLCKPCGSDSAGVLHWLHLLDPGSLKGTDLSGWGERIWLSLGWAVALSGFWPFTGTQEICENVIPFCLISMPGINHGLQSPNKVL